MGAFPNLSRNVPFCPRLFSFVPICPRSGPQEGQKTGTKTGHFGTNWETSPFSIYPHLALLKTPSCRVKSTPDPNTFEKYRYTPPISIAILLRKSAPSSWQKVVYTPPICITIRLPFVSRCFGRSIRVRGCWNTPKCSAIRFRKPLALALRHPSPLLTSILSPEPSGHNFWRMSSSNIFEDLIFLLACSVHLVRRR